jgi:hypothetical protein
MSKGPSTFRKGDVKRGVQALESAGLKVARVEIEKTGKLIFFPDNGANAEADKPEDIKL